MAGPTALAPARLKVAVACASISNSYLPKGSQPVSTMLEVRISLTLCQLTTMFVSLVVTPPTTLGFFAVKRIGTVTLPLEPVITRPLRYQVKPAEAKPWVLAVSANWYGWPQM